MGKTKEGSTVEREREWTAGKREGMDRGKKGEWTGKKEREWTGKKESKVWGGARYVEQKRGERVWKERQRAKKKKKRG